jgi:ArsR family transcriptional regulator
MKDLIKTFKALSDESRLRVLNLLLERECCVCEVMQALELSQSRTSRILSALRDAGILRARKDGRWSLYSIDREEMGDHLSYVVEAVAKALEGNPDAALDRERLKQVKRVGPSYAERMHAEKTGR